MAKIYEALEQAAREGRWEPRKQLFVLRQQEDTLRIASIEVQEKMVNLYRSIQARLPQQEGRIIHLLEPYKSQTASALTREFAKTVALRLDKKVLLLDATPLASQLASFGMFPNYSWQKAYRDHKSIREAIYQIGNTRLFVSQISRDYKAIAEVIESPLTDRYFQELRQVFDLVLVDSAPGIASANSIALASKADGVILVIEAEKTRWQVVKKLTQDIEQQGGFVLGTILSKRQYHIPQFLYDRL